MSNDNPSFPRGVDLEIVESPSVNKADGDTWFPIKPRRLKINGVEVLTPDDAPVLIEGLVDITTCAKATITVFINSLVVRDS